MRFALFAFTSILAISTAFAFPTDSNKDPDANGPSECYRKRNEKRCWDHP